MLQSLQETSGLLNSIDYFVSFDDIEAPLGHTHYSEQLVRLAGFHSQFTPPMHTASPGHNLSSRPQAEYTRAVSHADAVDSHLKQDDPFQGVSAAQTLRKAMGSVCGNGLETAMNESSSISNCSRPTLYLCPQTLYKLHPVFDAVIVDILLSDPCGRVLFLHGMTEAWDLIIVKRLADQVALKLGLIEKRYSLFSDQTACGALAAAQQHLERIIVGPQRGHNAFLGLLAAADVVVDSYPFGALPGPQGLVMLQAAM